MRRSALALSVAALVIAAPVAAGAAPATPSAPVVRPKPLAGVVIAIDPGHQLGNSNPKNFAALGAETRWNGTITKGCNTSGTATRAGYPEATFTFHTSMILRKRLRALGATVHMTRTTNSWDKWGPCTWNRGMFGAKVGADLMVSIHGDGNDAGGHGFFVIVPTKVTDSSWPHDIVAESQVLADKMVEGMKRAGDTPSTYISNAEMMSNDQNTLNFSDVPTVIVENGNMRDAGDAARMSNPKGQRQYARWLTAGIRNYLGK